MSVFSQLNRKFIYYNFKSANEFDFNLKTYAQLVPYLKFLSEKWLKIHFKGLDAIQHSKPLLIAANTSSYIPWPALLLSYGMMKELGIRLNIVTDIDSIEDERFYTFLKEIGFVSFSNENLKKIFANNEVAIVFPEGKAASNKPMSSKNRLLNFDWTQILPAVENNVEVRPLSTLGVDDSCPTLFNFDAMAKFLELPSFPVTPFFPFLPFPLNFLPLPGNWQMKLGSPINYSHRDLSNKNEVQESAKWVSFMLEGEIQAELNRMLRTK